MVIKPLDDPRIMPPIGRTQSQFERTGKDVQSLPLHLVRLHHIDG
jgi:hypothetical protein